jgi:hypothetical protein
MNNKLPSAGTKGLNWVRLTAILLITFSVSCVPAGPEPTEEPTEVVQPTTPPTEAPTEVPTEVPTEPPEPTLEPDEPEVPLGNGPWWLISAEDGLWAANPDGSGLVRLMDAATFEQQDIRSAVSPQGGYLAFITPDNPDKRWVGLNLNLMFIPPGGVWEIIPLLSSEFAEEQQAMPGDPWFEAYRAIDGFPNIRWSPDGQTLAFVGVIEGPTSDLYTYSLAEASITRLTDGPSQGFRPSWSPNGLYIAHVGADAFGTGAGFSMDGIWAARADDTGVETLHTVTGFSGDEVGVGWVSPTEPVFYTWDPMCGPSNVRAYEIGTEEVTVLWEGYFDDDYRGSIAADPVSGSVLVSVGRVASECNDDGTGGLYLLRTDQAAPIQVAQPPGGYIAWSPEVDLFLVVGEIGVRSVSPTGEVQELSTPVAELPAISPDGQLWALGASGSGELVGLWVGPFGQEPVQVYGGGVSYVAWGEGQTLMFSSGEGLYVASGPDFTPVLVGEGVEAWQEGTIVWVSP